ncbi:glutathione S-transferase family protein [Salinarimonas soli]|uniref:Glutathione S-transferase family protein n=1 Tax=Salinarimonas soli TaxID=1638099 RepID=A0A5B2VR43_9HYPH|nr:glutathione S-transferase family protein [Salinarimonas soli]KAA2242243.1 glutathione S-transferase family protein [Salinarimonas soli]
MLVLRSSPASPFGRKVKIAAALLGLTDRIRIVTADTLDPNDVLRTQNPLGKIPTLVLETGETLFDSRVIVEYLDALAGGGGVIPVSGPERFAALRLQALGDGLMDAALAQVYEGRFRPEEMRVQAWLDHQAGKVERALQALETAHAALGGRITVGEITIACALGYLDLRFAGRWRSEHSRLVAWLADFESRVPAYAATRPPT